VVLAVWLSDLKMEAEFSTETSENVHHTTRRHNPEDISLRSHCCDILNSRGNAYEDGPPLWSSGQSSWLQIRRPGFDSRHYQKKSSGSGTGSSQPSEYN
jgi:hypothetical protein